MPEVSVNGVETHYEVQGAGTPVLFIHGGYGGAATTLIPVPNVIRSVLPQDSFHLVTYDRRCCGQSQYVLREYTLVDLAADAAALLDHLGVGRAIIVGSSAGGPVALQFALAYPRRVVALSLPNTGANLMDQSRAVSVQRAQLVERFRKDGARAVFESRKEQLRTPPEVAGAAAAEMAVRRESLVAALAALPEDDLFRYSTGEICNFAAYLGFDFAPRLHELKMPVSVIHGTADATVPFEWGKALHDGIPQSEFHPIEGGVHGIIGNAAAAEVLRAWGSRVAAPARV